MKALVWKLVKGWVVSYIKSKMEDDEFKKLVIKTVNEKVDLPGLNEEKEKEIFDSLYDASYVAIESYIEII